MDWKGNKIEAIIFDMDGVVIDSEPLWKIAEISAFSSIGVQITETDLQETVGLRIDQVVAYWRNKIPWSTQISDSDVVNKIVDGVVSLVEERGKPLIGVHELLNWLKVNGYKIGLATSSYHKIVNAVLKKLELQNYFDVTCSAEDEQYGKPHPAVFLSCANQLKVDPTKCLVIEDSFNGLLAAKAASMHTIVVPDQSNEPHPHLHIADCIARDLIVVKAMLELADKTK